MARSRPVCALQIALCCCRASSWSGSDCYPEAAQEASSGLRHGHESECPSGATRELCRCQYSPPIKWENQYVRQHRNSAGFAAIRDRHILPVRPIQMAAKRNRSEREANLVRGVTRRGACVHTAPVGRNGSARRLSRRICCVGLTEPQSAQTMPPPYTGCMLDPAHRRRSEAGLRAVAYGRLVCG